MNGNAEKNVLSLSAETELLAQRESVLRGAGYQVLSTISEAEVRFEIQMGQCGVLLLCYTMHEVIHRDLAEIFIRNCRGTIVFVMHPLRKEESRHAHINLLDSEFSHKLHLIKSAHAQHSKSA